MIKTSFSDQLPDQLYDSTFLRCLALSFEPGSGALALAMPGNPFSAALNRDNPKLTVIEAISSDLLATYAGFGENLRDHSGGQLVVAPEDGQVRIREASALGAGFTTAQATDFKTQSLSDLIAGMRDPALLYLDCECDAGGLLVSALEPILKRGTVVWAELSARNRQPVLEMLRQSPHLTQFEFFGLDPAQGCLDLGQDKDTPIGDTLLGILLVPKWRWNCHWLQHLAAGKSAREQMGDLRAPLLVPGTRNASEQTLSILSDLRPAPPPPERPKKIFLAAMDHVFGYHTQAGPLSDDDETTGLSTAGMSRVKLAFVPPAPGRFEVRIVLAWPPKQALKLRHANRVIPLVWNEDWYHVHSQGQLMTGQVNRPIVVELSHDGPQSDLGLMIKGVELDYQENPGM